MKLDNAVTKLFSIAVLACDSSLIITAINDEFEQIFGDITGQPLQDISDDFNQRKCDRRLNAGQPYHFRISTSDERPSVFTVELRPYHDSYIGFATNAAEALKSEAMMASYSHMIEKQNQEIKAKTEQLNIWSKRINDELIQAKTVQNLLVPEKITAAGLDSRCLPLRELSGDFHELATDDDGTITFISGDVAGKGIYAAIILAQTLTAFRACYNAPNLTDVVVQIATILEDRFPDGLFVALTLVRQSADKNTISILNLGNPDALLMDETIIHAKIESVGPAIGVLPATFYSDILESRYVLTGKQLYVFSDGIIDLAVENQDLSSDDPTSIHNYLLQLNQLHGAESLDYLMTEVERHKQIDDVTIACFRSDSGLSQP